MAAKAKKATKSTAVSPASAREPAAVEHVRVRMFEGHENFVWRVAMPADGSFALTSSEDGTVRRWELGEDDAKSEILSHAKHFYGLAVTADGTSAAAADDGATIQSSTFARPGRFRNGKVTSVM